MITGGAGFIGSNLTRLLLDNGERVICIDDLSSGSVENILEFEGHPLFEFVEHDVTEPIPSRVTVQQVYHLACPASPAFYQKNPVQTVRTNVLGTLNVLEFATSCNATVLQASTSEVYGDPTVHPQKEDYWGNVNPIGYRSCYDEGKRCAETLFFDYHRQYGTKIKVARIFNTYGPNMRTDDGRIVPNSIVAALQNRELTIYGDGSQTRSFCYVSDLISGLVKLMNAPEQVVGPFNLGNSTETEVLELARVVLKLTEAEAEICYRSLPRDDPRRRKPDVKSAAQVLGWNATTDLESGIRQTIEYFRSKGT